MSNQTSGKKDTSGNKPSSLPFIEETTGGLFIRVRVQPRSSKNAICGVKGNAVKVKLTAPPVEGEANKRLIELFSAVIGIKKSAFTIDCGQKSKDKRVRVDELSRAELEKALKEAVGESL